MPQLKPIISKTLFAILFVLAISLCFSPAIHVVSAQEQGVSGDQASTFEELKQWLDAHMSTGGTVTLTDDIIIPEGETYSYMNSRYSKQIHIDAGDHTIYVQGHLELWPYLSITGTGGTEGIFHILSGGRLDMTAISVSASTPDAIAIVQNPGAILIRSDMGFGDFPPFSCQGQVITSPDIVAEPYSAYNPNELPVVVVAPGETFTSSMLPSTVDSDWYDGMSQHSGPLPVIWDAETFPSTDERTIVSGSYPAGYLPFRDASITCLVVFTQENAPVFLNSYASLYSGTTIIQLNSLSPIDGEATLEGSYDGENWESIENQTFEEGQAQWQIFYSQDQTPYRYFSIMQQKSDGSIVYSDTLELTEENTLIASDIGGGRGGETPPNEGDTQLPPLQEDLPPIQDSTQEEPASSASSEPIASPTEPAAPPTEQTVSGGHTTLTPEEPALSTPEVSSSTDSSASSTEGTEGPLEKDTSTATAQVPNTPVPQQESQALSSTSTATMPSWLQILIGIAILLVILVGVLLFALRVSNTRSHRPSSK